MIILFRNNTTLLASECLLHGVNIATADMYSDSHTGASLFNVPASQHTPTHTSLYYTHPICRVVEQQIPAYKQKRFGLNRRFGLKASLAPQTFWNICIVVVYAKPL